VIKKAISAISNTSDIELIKTAPLYLTKAWGKTDQDDFINTAIEVKTSLTANELLNCLQDIEIKLGRVQTVKWGPRIIDIDILMYSDIVVNQPQLTIPHPYILQRSFVIAPLLALNSEISLPELGKIANHIDEKWLKSEIIAVI